MTGLDAAGKNAEWDTAPAPSRWPRSLAVLHWITVLLLIPLFWSGWAGGVHASTSDLHISIGVSLLLVLLLRIAIRFRATAPRPIHSRVLLRRTAGGIQLSLYILMLTAGVTGMLATSSHPFMPGPRLFGMFELGQLSSGAVVRASASVHRYVIWTFLAAAVLHVASVIYYVIFSDRRILRRMM